MRSMDRIEQLEERLRKLEEKVEQLYSIVRSLVEYLRFDPCPYRTVTVQIDHGDEGLTIRIVPFCTGIGKVCKYRSVKSCPHILNFKVGKQG